jgi:membrane-bound lytic murein transglycosylase D
MKTSAVVGIIAGAHCVLVGSFVLMQGCGKTTAVARQPLDDDLMPPLEVDYMPPPPEKPVLAPEVTVPPAPEEEKQPYTVRKGNCLSKIASRYGVTLKEIMALNDIADPDRIVAGDTLWLPARADVGEAPPPRRPDPKPDVSDVPPTPGGKYVIQPGDTLSGIAAKYGTTVNALKTLNGLTNDRIYAGKTLVMPDLATDLPDDLSGPVVPVRPPEPETAEDDDTAALLEEIGVAPEDNDPVYYTVREGQTLNDVAKRVGVSARRLRAANNLPTDRVSPGMRLRIPRD